MSITHLRAIAIGLPEFESAASFYQEQWRLEAVAADSDMLYLGAVGSPEAHSLRVRRAPERRIDYVAFAVDSPTSVDALATGLARAGVRMVGEPDKIGQHGGGYGFRFFDPDGNVVELSADVAGKEVRQVVERDSTPVKISHVVLNAPDIEATAAFYVNQLGMRVSDRLADSMIFLRCNNDHHSLALHRSANRSLNHVSWETRGVDEFMRAAGRLLRSGQNMVWGPGRHGPGDNTFAYFTEPNGYVMEVTTALAQVEEETWEPRVWERSPEIADQWGVAGPIPEQAIVALDGSADPGLWTAPPC